MCSKKAENINAGMFIDEPLESLSADKFGHKHYINVLKDLISTCHTPFNIGLFGRWGVGKTTILSLLKQEIDKEKQYKTISFNAWKYSNEPIPLKRKFLLEVSDQTGCQSKRLREALYLKGQHQIKNVSLLDTEHNLTEGITKIIKSYFNAIIAFLALQMILYIIVNLFTSIKVDIFFNAAITATLLYATKIIKDYTSNVTVTKSNVNLESLEQFEKAFKDIIDEVENKCVKIVIFIDDLDRCESKKVIEILEVIKTFMNMKNCIYVVACDDIIIRKALLEQGISDNSYIDKIFQMSLAIPPFRYENIKNYAKNLFSQFNFLSDEKDITEIVSILIYKGVESPRKVKILINNYGVLIRILTQRLSENTYLNKNFDIDYKFLAKITVIQTDFKEFFHDLEKNNRLLYYIDKIRLGNVEFENSQLNLLNKYFEIKDDELDDINLDKFVVRENYRKLIQYLNYTSSYIPSPEKTKAYIHLSQDNINMTYSDEYVEELQNLLLSNNAVQFAKRYKENKSFDEKNIIINSLISKLDDFNGLDIVNILGCFTNRELINIVPDNIIRYFSQVILRKVSENLNYANRFDIKGIVYCIRIYGDYKDYSNIINRYIKMLNTNDLDNSYYIIESICTCELLNFNLEEFDNFLVKLSEVDFDRLFKLISNCANDIKVLNNYFLGNIYKEIFSKDANYDDNEKSILVKYLSSTKDTLMNKNINMLLESILIFINDSDSDLSLESINIANEIVSRKININMYLEKLTTTLSHEANKWTKEEVIGKIFMILIEIVKNYNLGEEIKDKFYKILNDNYSEAKNSFVNCYIKYIREIISRQGDTDLLVSNIIKNIESSNSNNLRLDELIENLEGFITLQQKNDILNSIILNLNNSNKRRKQLAMQNYLAIIENCKHIMDSSMMLQVSDCLVAICNDYNYELDNVIEMTLNTYSNILHVLNNENINKYFNLLFGKINSEDVSDVALGLLEKDFKYASSSEVIENLCKNVLDKNSDKSIDILLYYGKDVVFKLLEKIFIYIDDNFQLSEQINNVIRIIDGVEYNQQEAIYTIVSLIINIFDSDVQHNIFNYIFDNYESRGSVIKLFTDGKMNIANRFILKIISEKIVNDTERKEYNKLITKDIKEKTTYEELKDRVLILIEMKVKNTYLNNDEINRYVNGMFVHLLGGTEIQKRVALEMLPKYYCEQKFPSRIKAKFAGLISEIIDTNDTLKNLAINIVRDTELYKGNSKVIRDLKQKLDEYIQEKNVG
jgi:hypothetical protein